MKYAVFLFLLLVSCAKQEKTIENIIFENDRVNTTFFKQMEEPEKALLSWYLYAYGNACDAKSNKVKCRLLDHLQIQDECAMEHLRFLRKWMSKDALAKHKLRSCPNLPVKSSIQNSFDKIILYRKGDTLSIQYTVEGLNNSQEKSWNIAQTDTYFISGGTFVKVRSTQP